MNRTVDLIYQSSHTQQSASLQPGMALWAVLVALVYTLGTLWLPHQSSALQYGDYIVSGNAPALPAPADASTQPQPFRIPDTILPLITHAAHLDSLQALEPESLNAAATHTAAGNTVSTGFELADDTPLQVGKPLVAPSLATVAERMAALIKSNQIDAAIKLQRLSFTGDHASRLSSIVIEQLLPSDVDLAVSWLAIAPGLSPDQQTYWAARLAEAQGKYADVIRLLKSKQAAWLEHIAQHREELALLGTAQLAEGDSIQALTIFRALTQQKNTNSHWHLGMAMAAEQRGERQLAISAYRNSLAPDDMNISSKRFARNRLYTLLADNND